VGLTGAPALALRQKPPTISRRRIVETRMAPSYASCRNHCGYVRRVKFRPGTPEPRAVRYFELRTAPDHFGHCDGGTDTGTRAARCIRPQLPDAAAESQADVEQPDCRLIAARHRDRSRFSTRLRSVRAPKRSR